jgi:energy-coupling factor transport system substrate-specific component
MIGVRFSLYPMRDDFVPLILAAVDGLDRLGVQVETDDVSTCLLGEEPNLFEALRVAFGRAACSGAHVVLNATFSAGCPGEPDGDVCVPRAYDGPSGGEEGWSQEAYRLPAAVAAQFALYPLGEGGYMDTIYTEIDRARQAGVVQVVGRHFCTHLYGPGAAVFDVVRRSFAETRTQATHSVMTVTLSANSPSLASGEVVR